MMSTARLNDSTSKVPSSRRNFMRFSEARLHALSSTCMYSLHGLDALIRPEFGLVCHWLMVVSYCTPGSAQRHAASAISRMSSYSGRINASNPCSEYMHVDDSACNLASINLMKYR